MKDAVHWRSPAVVLCLRHPGRLALVLLLAGWTVYRSPVMAVMMSVPVTCQ